MERTFLLIMMILSIISCILAAMADNYICAASDAILTYLWGYYLKLLKENK